MGPKNEAFGYDHVYQGLGSSPPSVTSKPAPVLGSDASKSLQQGGQVLNQIPVGRSVRLPNSRAPFRGLWARAATSARAMGLRRALLLPGKARGPGVPPVRSRAGT